jgi:hypothetical protein
VNLLMLQAKIGGYVTRADDAVARHSERESGLYAPKSVAMLRFTTADNCLSGKNTGDPQRFDRAAYWRRN